MATRVQFSMRATSIDRGCPSSGAIGDFQVQMLRISPSSKGMQSSRAFYSSTAHHGKGGMDTTTTCTARSRGRRETTIQLRVIGRVVPRC